MAMILSLIIVNIVFVAFILQGNRFKLKKKLHLKSKTIPLKYVESKILNLGYLIDFKNGSQLLIFQKLNLYKQT